MFLSNLSIKRPVVATVMILTLVTLGIFSARRLPIDQMPDVEIPVLSIITEYPGASPETVEREVTKKIEEAVNPIAGVKHIQSVSREGLSTIIVEFELEVKVNDVSQEARAKINAVRRELPDEMKEPVIEKFDFGAMPIISLAIQSSSMSPRDLTTLADRRIKRRLESIHGVAKAKLIGSSVREIAVDIDPARLAAYGMGVDEVVAGLASENVNTPLGRLTQGDTEMPLRISGKPHDAAEYRTMVITRRAGQPIRLGDLATIEDGVEEPRSLAVINGKPAVAIDITKQTKANTVVVVDAVREAVAKLQAEMPPGTTIQIVRDTSTFIRESVSDVYNTLVLGGLLTIVIVFFFLNSWRSTVITGLTLPISVVSSFIVMYFLNMTINTLTLMALSLAIGLLIDDAIVVRENIVRHLERGQDHFEAAREGTAEIGLAVLATSMSIIAVFVPVAFMKGIIGRFFYQFGLTVAFAVLVSLFVSFTLDPMLSSRWYDPDIERAGKRNLLQRALDRFNDWFERMAEGYKRVIAWSLDHRFVVVGAALAAFVGGMAVFGLLQTEFMTPMDQGEFALKFKSAPGSSIAETRGRLEAVLKGLAGFPEVQYTYAAIGAGDSDTVRDATVFVRLVPRNARALSVKQFTHVARQRLEKVPGVTLNFLEDPSSFQKPLAIAVQGDDIATLKQYAGRLKDAMYKIPGIVDIEASMEQDLPEYRMTVDRDRAAASGVGSSSVAGTVGMLVGGQAVSTYEDEEGEAVNVRVRLPQALRGDVSQVENLKITVPGPAGASLVPLADLVTFTRATSPAEINRRDLTRQVTVDANLDNLPLGTASNLAMKAGEGLNMAPGYKLVQGGDTEMMIESFGYMGEALLLAVIFVYLILSAQFESFVDPLSIMLSLPLSIVGMAGTLLLTGDTINIMSLIGLIMLMGLVTKNAILLIDYTKVLRGRGLDRRTALITAGRTRLRPIMMTTSAMIFGMLPLFFALGEGAEMRAPMARAVVGGLITSTMLTLIVVPVVYTLLDDISAWIGRKAARHARAAAVALVVAALLAGQSARASAQSDGRAGLTASADRAAVQAAGQAPGQASAPAPAQASAPGEVKVLTLEDALAVAASHNRDIQKAIEYQKWVQGKYLEERAAALPQLSFSGSLVRNFDNRQKDLFNLFSSGGFLRRVVGDRLGPRRDLQRPAGRADRAGERQAGDLHLGPGRRRGPRRQAGLRRRRPAAPPVPPGGHAGRDDGLLRRARRAGAGDHRRGGPGAEAAAPGRDHQAAVGRHRHRLRRARRAGGGRERPAHAHPRAERGAGGPDATGLPAGRHGGGRRDRRARRPDRRGADLRVGAGARARQPPGAGRAGQHARRLQGAAEDLAGREQAEGRLLGRLGHGPDRPAVGVVERLPLERRRRRLGAAVRRLADQGPGGAGRDRLGARGSRRQEAARGDRRRGADGGGRGARVVGDREGGDRHGDAGRAAPVPGREGIRTRREDAARGAGRRAEPVVGAREPGAGAARLPRRPRQPRVGGGDARQVRAQG